MKKITAEEIMAARELLALLGPEPWLVGHGGATKHPYVETTQLGSDDRIYGAACWASDDDRAEPPTQESENVARFIAAVRALVPQLLDEVERGRLMDARNQQASDELCRLNDVLLSELEILRERDRFVTRQLVPELERLRPVYEAAKAWFADDGGRGPRGAEELRWSVGVAIARETTGP